MIEKNYTSLEYIELPKHIQEMFAHATASLKLQTEVWHINSPKKVCACLYLEREKQFILGQNIGISKTTGSICAERAAIITAVSLYPNISGKEINELCICGEYSPIFPCGVCAEWLHKVNPGMMIYSHWHDSTYIALPISKILLTEDNL